MRRRHKKLHGKPSSRRVTIDRLESRTLLSAAPTLWADDAAGRLFTVNVASGAVHVIGQMPADMYDIAYDAKGNLYGVDGASGVSNLWKINPANGSAQEIGSLGASVNSLVFSDSGTLYAAGSALYTINTATGHATMVGTANLSGYASAGDLAFDASGNLDLSASNGDLVRINTTTGAASLIGAMGFDEVYGLAEGPDGVLYGMANSTSQIFSINPATGQGTLLASFANEGVAGVNGTSFITEAIAPSIEVDGQGVKIADGDTTPAAADGTLYSAAALSAPTTHTFTIKNNTASTVTLTNPALTASSGANAGDFSVVTEPAASLAAGASTTFAVQFDPTAIGTRAATVTIANSSEQDSSYTFSLQGTGIVPPPAPGIEVDCNGLKIADGDVTPAAADGTAFGTLALKTPATHTFTIRNDGPATIKLTNTPLVTITGANASDFSVITAPTSSLASGASTSFTIQFNPSAAGTRTAIVTVPNSGASDGKYGFEITGVGVVPPPPPSVEVDGNKLKIADGDMTPTAADGTSFASAALNTPALHTFTIKNNTASTVTMTNKPLITIAGANAADFSIVAQPASSLAPGASATFSIQFDPSAAGTRVATVTIANSSAADGKYVFEISGVGVAPAAVQPILYASDTSGELFTVNAKTGASQAIGRLPAIMLDLAFSPRNVLYGVDVNGNIWQINSATAEGVEIGPTGYGDAIDSLVFSSTGTLYASGRVGFYSINTATGAATLIGLLGSQFVSSGDLAFDSAGTLLLTASDSADPSSDHLVSINPATGHASDIGAIGYQQVYGMAVGQDGILYGMASGVEKVFSINPITGQASNAVSFGGTNINGVDGAAVMFA